MTPAERVNIVAAMMRAGTFKVGVTYKALSKEWGVSEREGKRFCAEASRRVVAERDTDGARDYAVTKVRKAVAMAERDGDVKAMVAALHEHAMIHGLHAPKQIQARHEVSLEGKSREEIAAMARQLTEEVLALVAAE